MSAHITPRHRLHGFTLIEIVIGLVLLGLLGVVGANMISGSVFTNQAISNEKLAYASARYALERMSREIREMQYDTVNSKMAIATPALDMTANRLSFTKTGLSANTLVTLTFSGTVPGAISLAYSGGSAEDLVQNLSNTGGVFTYLQADGTTPTTDPATVRYVRIDLNVKPDNTQNQVLALSNVIYLRNR